MSDPVLLIVGIVVFALMFIAIVFTFLEFRQLGPADSPQRNADGDGGRKRQM